jgi:hypothetical protein
MSNCDLTKTPHHGLWHYLNLQLADEMGTASKTPLTWQQQFNRADGAKTMFPELHIMRNQYMDHGTYTSKILYYTKWKYHQKVLPYT